MSNDEDWYDDYDDDIEDGDFSEVKRKKETCKKSSGGLCIAQTLAAFLSVAAVSFAMAYFTRNIETRPIWLLALIFGLPVMALFASTLLVENATSSMTPSTSRMAQLGLSAACVAFALLTGCMCQIANTEAKKPQLVQTEGWSDTIILLDKSGSMSGNDDTAASASVRELLDSMDESVSAGIVAYSFYGQSEYSGDGMHEVPMAPLTESHKQKLMTVAKCSPNGGTDYGVAVGLGLKAVKEYAAANPNHGSINMIMVTDGMPNDGFTASSYMTECQNLGVKVSYIRIGTTSCAEMEKLVTATGGKSVDVANALSLGSEMKTIVKESSTVEIKRDALRDINISGRAKAVVGAMLAVIGIMLGIAMTMMYSRQGQKRVQLILSPVLCAAAFLLLAFGQNLIPVSWVREGVAFSLQGLVFMKENG